MRVFFRFVFTGLVLVAMVLIGLRLVANNRETIALGQELPLGGQLIETAEGAVFELERGPDTGVPVLFAHGTAAWSGLWLPTLDSVADAGFHAIAFDMPPFGWSQHPEDSDYSRPKQADRVIALLEALDNQPIAVAHSIGAGPVVEAVMRRPDLVSGLVVVNGAIALGRHDPPTETPIYLQSDTVRLFIASATVSNPILTKAFLRSFLHIKSAATDDVTALLQEPMARIGYTDAVADWLPQLLVPPQNALSTRAENWQALQLPVGLIWGVEDTVTPLEQAEELLTLIPDAQYRALSGVGHIPQLEDPQAFQAALIEILQTFSNARPDEADS